MKWLRGYLLCSTESGQWERFMNLCRHHGIRLWKVNIHKNHVTFCMFSGDYRQLKAFVGKTHVIPHIREKRGLPFLCMNAVRNWTFTFGLVLFFAVLKFLSLFVWQINYYGQREYTQESISKEVTKMGVYTGMFRKNLNCDSIERSLRETCENMSWVSAEEKGCILNIKVKEGNAEKKKEETEEAPAHLTAPCDGKIQSIITQKGTPLVKKGASVKKGDVLIRGVVEIMDDSGETIKYNGVHAEGEICLVTEKAYEESINIQYMDKNKTGRDMKIYTVQCNGSRFSIKNPLKWFDNSSSYDIINNVCVDRKFIPLDMSLKITERTLIGYERKRAQYSEKEASDILKRHFLSKQEEYKENGYQILDQSLRIKKEQKAFRASGMIKMLVTEMEHTDVTGEELMPDEKRKEDDDGTGRENH